MRDVYRRQSARSGVGASECASGVLPRPRAAALKGRDSRVEVARGLSRKDEQGRRNLPPRLHPLTFIARMSTGICCIHGDADIHGDGSRSDRKRLAVWNGSGGDLAAEMQLSARRTESVYSRSESVGGGRRSDVRFDLRGYLNSG